MKKFFVRKTFPYDPTFNSKYSKYEGYKLITLQKASPDIKQAYNIEFSNLNSPIFSSPLERALDTARVISKKMRITTIVILPELVEIVFDLQKLVSKSEYEKFGSNLVRKKFIEAFRKNELEESREMIEKRIKKLLRKMDKLPRGNYLLVSHSFFMKILQIYLQDKRLFLRPSILERKFDYKRKTFSFGGGFDFII